MYATVLALITYVILGLTLGSRVKVIGKLFALPVTLIGLIVGFIGGPSTRWSIQHNAVCIENYPFGIQGAAMTLGNVIICCGLLSRVVTTYEENETGVKQAPVVLGDHEEEHTRQWERFGVLFAILWFAHRGATYKNPYEAAADESAHRNEINP